MKKGKKSIRDYGGLDPNLIDTIMKNIKPNPVTGRIDMSDIASYMAQNPDQMNDLTSAMDNLKAGHSGQNLSTYDYASLGKTIKHESAWVVQLENMGFVDRSGKEVDPSQVGRIDGVRPTFALYCYDEKGSFRATENTTGLPDSEAVLQFIRSSMVTPLPPLKPALPWFFMLSSKLGQHADYLRPFLDSLPAPFHWRVETAEEAENLKEGIHQENTRGVFEGLKRGAEAKKRGNASFVKKNRNAALNEYSEAIEHYAMALSQKPDVEEEKLGKEQLAICYANRAAAYLIPGDGLDAKKALVDGKKAASLDPDYAKAYVRQATAHEALGQANEAKNVIANALRRPSLENDHGLVDRLIDLYTGGKGLPDNEAEYKEWTLDVMVNDKQSMDRLRGLGGEWKRRCDAQFAKWKRER